MKDEYSEDLLRLEEWEKGIAKGCEEGSKIKALDIASNLLDVLDEATIAKKTGLSATEIAQLRQGKR